MTPTVCPRGIENETSSRAVNRSRCGKRPSIALSAADLSEASRRRTRNTLLTSRNSIAASGAGASRGKGVSVAEIMTGALV
jgi:hypothetical protein